MATSTNIPTPKKSRTILGIDLGTCNSAVAMTTKGKAINLEIDGQKIVPSVVAFRSEDKILVGELAKRQMLINPDKTIRSIKSEMGNDEYSKDIFGKKYTPVDIAGLILSKLREGAQKHLKGMAKYAVICVPANFDDNKRKATRKAAALANLEVIALLEEPIAAAIAYGYEQNREQTILVYDLGGGTFDVSILKVESSKGVKNNLSVLAKEGIPKLGGDDFDKKLMEKIAEEFKAAHNIDIFDLKIDQAGGISAKVLREVQQRLQEAVEVAKQDLSELDSTNITIPSFLKDGDGKEYSIDREVQRTEFEELIKDLVQQTESSVKKALDNAKLTIDDISRIILVGGSTRVHLVKKMLTDMFKKDPYAAPDRDTIVARGAALFGATQEVPKEDDLEDHDPDNDIDTEMHMNDIVTHNLGIEITTRTEAQVFSRLIAKGDELTDENPEITVSKDFSKQNDDQKEMRITVFQTPDEDVKYVNEKDKDVVCIGEFWLTGIPKGPGLVTVTFTINRQNEVFIKAKSKVDEKVEQEIKIDRE